MAMKITRIEIRDYRGVREQHFDVPPAGVVIKGANALGKTSVLRAITAALAGKGVDREAIRIGADDAEILIDLEKIKVRRTITQKSNSLTVSSHEGAIYPKPQTMLTDLLGSSALDPLNFYLAKAKERREIVLEAIPLRVTLEQIERWTGLSLTAGTIFGMPIVGKLETMHGLDVIATVHKLFFDQRATANREAKAAENALEVARVDAKALPQVSLNTPVRRDAEATLAAAERAHRELTARRASAVRAREAVVKTRARIVDLRARADAKEASIPTPAAAADVTRLTARKSELDAEIAALKSRLAALEVERNSSAELLDRIARAYADDLRTREEVSGMRDDARALETSLTDVEAMDVSDVEIAAAAAVVTTAADGVNAAEKADDLRAAIAKCERLDAEAKAAGAKAGALTEVVDRLAKEAPVELAKSPHMIPGLAMDGDEITLDGVSLDGRSGAEQMKFAVDLAKRANAKSKILIVDGLERLDSKQMEAFVRMSTADDWQLLCTRVADGEVVIEAIAVVPAP